MISDTEKNRIKQILGWRCAPIIKDYMEKKGVKNRTGNSYSTQMITNVLNGQPHEKIEDAIYELVAIKLKKQNAQKDLLKEKPAVSSASS